METPVDDELGEWIRMEQDNGDYIHCRASHVSTVQEVSGKDGDVMIVVTLFNGAKFTITEKPIEVIWRVRAATNKERKMTR